MFTFESQYFYGGFSELNQLHETGIYSFGEQNSWQEYEYTKEGERCKRSDVATHSGLSESVCTKYESGESQITVDIIQKVAKFHNIDPLSLLSTPAGSFNDSGNNSPGAIVGNHNVQIMSNEQTKLLTKLIETQISMTEKIMALPEKKQEQAVACSL